MEVGGSEWSGLCRKEMLKEGYLALSLFFSFSSTGLLWSSFLSQINGHCTSTTCLTLWDSFVYESWDVWVVSASTFRFIFMCVWIHLLVYLCVCACICRNPRSKKRMLEALDLELLDDCKFSYLSAGWGSWVLWKSSEHSNHWAISPGCAIASLELKKVLLRFSLDAVFSPKPGVRKVSCLRLSGIIHSVLFS